MIQSNAPTLADFSATDISGIRTSLKHYAGKVALIVNTASKCGFVPQLRGLQQLYERYAPQGFAVLAFPCNQFLNQEPRSPAEIAEFCSSSYRISFPLFHPVQVNGPHTHPLYAWLKEQAPGVLGTQAIKWNFTKFLLDRSGRPVVRYAPTMAPEHIAATIERLLRHPVPA